MINSRSLAFFPRQLRDVLVTRGVAMLLIGALIVIPFFIDLTDAPPETHARALERMLEGMAFFLVMLATYGIIGEDMRRGHFRLLFSKPISPVIYYLQAFVVAWLSFLVVQLAFVAVFAIVFTPVWPHQKLADVSFQFLLLGAVIFGLSRFTRLDWLFGMLLLVFGNVLRSVYPAAESVRGKVVNLLFPPSHLFERGTFFPLDGPEWGAMLWVTGYAALFLVAGLAAVRLVPFGTAR